MAHTINHSESFHATYPRVTCESGRYLVSHLTIEPVGADLVDLVGEPRDNIEKIIGERLEPQVPKVIKRLAIEASYESGTLELSFDLTAHSQKPAALVTAIMGMKIVEVRGLDPRDVRLRPGFLVDGESLAAARHHRAEAEQVHLSPWDLPAEPIYAAVCEAVHDRAIQRFLAHQTMLEAHNIPYLPDRRVSLPPSRPRPFPTFKPLAA